MKWEKEVRDCFWKEKHLQGRLPVWQWQPEGSCADFRLCLAITREREVHPPTFVPLE